MNEIWQASLKRRENLAAETAGAKAGGPGKPKKPSIVGIKGLMAAKFNAIMNKKRKSMLKGEKPGSKKAKLVSAYFSNELAFAPTKTMVATLVKQEKLEMAEAKRRTNFNQLSVAGMGAGSTRMIQRLMEEEQAAAGRQSKGRASLKKISRDSQRLGESRLSQTHKHKE